MKCNRISKAGRERQVVDKVEAKKWRKPGRRQNKSCRKSWKVGENRRPATFLLAAVKSARRLVLIDWQFIFDHLHLHSICLNHTSTIERELEIYCLHRQHHSCSFFCSLELCDAENMLFYFWSGREMPLFRVSLVHCFCNVFAHSWFEISSPHIVYMKIFTPGLVNIRDLTPDRFATWYSHP